MSYLYFVIMPFGLNSWVQTQLKNHPDELWDDGLRDYLSHASSIMVLFPHFTLLYGHRSACFVGSHNYEVLLHVVVLEP